MDHLLFLPLVVDPPPPTVPPDSVKEQPSIKSQTKWDKIKQKYAARCQRRLDKNTTALVDSGATSIFLTKDAPKTNVDHNALHIKVGHISSMLCIPAVNFPRRT